MKFLVCFHPCRIAAVTATHLMKMSKLYLQKNIIQNLFFLKEIVAVQVRKPKFLSFCTATTVYEMKSATT